MEEQTCCICKEMGNKMSLEHSIPKFLHGQKSDIKFKKLPICQTCNNQLGLHVDGRFAKSFLIYSKLLDLDNSDFVKATSITKDIHKELEELLKSDEYIDPIFHEKINIYWLKKNTEQFSGLIGGHPIKRKQEEISKLFVFINEGSYQGISENDLNSLIQKIHQELKLGKKAEILLCINFKFPDGQRDFLKQHLEDKYKNKVKFIWEFSYEENKLYLFLEKTASEGFTTSVEISLGDYIKFLAKLFFGVIAGYAGTDFIQSSVAQELIHIMNEHSSTKIFSQYKDKFALTKVETNESDGVFTAPFTIIIGVFNLKDRIIGFLSISGVFMKFDICSTSVLDAGILKKMNINPQEPKGMILTYTKGDNEYKELDFHEYAFQQIIEKNTNCTQLLSSLSPKELAVLKDNLKNKFLPFLYL